MIKELSKIGSTHKTNEDSQYVSDTERYLYLFVSDGCSGGLDSAFASGLFKKMFKKILIDKKNMGIFLKQPKEEALYIMRELFEDLRIYRKNLSLEKNELEATIGICVIDKYTKNAIVVFSGDGIYAIDHNIVSIDQNNQPKYISQYQDWNDFKESLTIDLFAYTDQVALSTDGLESFRSNTEKFNLSELFINDRWRNENKTCLSRKLKMLSKGIFPGYEKIINQDDISLIIYQCN